MRASAGPRGRGLRRWGRSGRSRHLPGHPRRGHAAGPLGRTSSDAAAAAALPCRAFFQGRGLAIRRLLHQGRFGLEVIRGSKRERRPLQPRLPPLPCSGGAVAARAPQRGWLRWRLCRRRWPGRREALQSPAARARVWRLPLREDRVYSLSGPAGSPGPRARPAPQRPPHQQQRTTPRGCTATGSPTASAAARGRPEPAHSRCTAQGGAPRRPQPRLAPGPGATCGPASVVVSAAG